MAKSKNKKHTPNTRKRNNDRGSVFDSVFKTICQKMPELLIPVINEAFGTKYKENVKITQLRTEQHDAYGIRDKDSLFEIEGHKYHIENQSTDDSNMAIRMIEYDFSVALEYLNKTDGEKVLQFPKSCVIYIRKGDTKLRNQNVKVVFPDGNTQNYTYEVIEIQNYSKDEIFKKNLLMFLPYYLLRYEDNMPTEEDSDSYRSMIADLKDLLRQLSIESKANKHNIYENITTLIDKIAGHIIKNNNIRKRVNEEMKGIVYDLPSDKIKRAKIKAEKRGKEIGKELEIISLVSEKLLSEEIGAQRLGITVDELRERINKEELDVM